MKAFTVITVILLSCIAFAQSPVVERAPQNYLKALKSENQGMVECAIFHVVKFSLFYPDQNMNRIEAQLDQLAQHNQSNTIRYKAYLAGQYLQEELLRGKIQIKDYKDGNEFFKMLADTLQQNLFATND